MICEAQAELKKIAAKETKEFQLFPEYTDELYARIDHADEDELIESLIRAADTAVRDMTGKEPPSDSDELFDTAVLQLTAHWYENRTPVTDTSVTQVPFTVQTLLNHIALSGRYPEKEGLNAADQ